MFILCVCLTINVEKLRVIRRSDGEYVFSHKSAGFTPGFIRAPTMLDITGDDDIIDLVDSDEEESQAPPPTTSEKVRKRKKRKKTWFEELQESSSESDDDEESYEFGVEQDSYEPEDVEDSDWTPDDNEGTYVC